MSIISLGTDELTLAFSPIAPADIAAVLESCKTLAELDSPAFWEAACLARWGMRVSEFAKAVYFVRNAVELSPSKMGGIDLARCSTMDTVTRELASAESFPNHTLIRRLEEGGLNMIGSTRIKSSQVSWWHALTNAAVCAVFGPRGELTTFHFQDESLKDSGAGGYTRCSRWVMAAHLIPAEAINEMFDYTLYSRGEFEELLPGVCKPGEAVRSYLCNFREEEDGRLFQDPCQAALFNGMNISEEFILSMPHGTFTRLEMLVSVVGQWSWLYADRLLRASHGKPGPRKLARLLTALGLARCDVEASDLLLALLLAFQPVSQFTASDWFRQYEDLAPSVQVLPHHHAWAIRGTWK
tara:strand:+ start:21919 stop:22980 length:1062 start_codon:yes stop_codon:yes gene_type:complete